MIVVFISSSFGPHYDDDINRVFSTMDLLLSKGYAVCPTLFTARFLQGMKLLSQSPQYANIELMNRCDVLLCLQGYSHITDYEIELSKSIKMPIYHSVESLIENVPANALEVVNG